MNSGGQSPNQLFGYDVVDSTGSKIGSVDGVLVDDASDELEFVGVKTGWIVGKTHIIPLADAQIGDGTIRVPYSEDQIKDAPGFGTDDELTPAQEDEVYQYYGLDRSTAPSPSGLPTGTGTGGYGTADVADADVTTGVATDAVTTGNVSGTTNLDEEQRVRLHEEELAVGKREVEAGRVRLRKVVRTERVEQPVELRHEELDIQRVPVTDGEVAPGAFQEGEIEVPVMREEPVVGKEARVTGEVRLDKDVKTETREVGGEVRREDVEVDRDTVTGEDTSRIP